MKSKIPLYTILTTVLIFSCNEEPEKRSVSFKWVPSEFSRYGSSFFSFRTGDDNRLYSAGFVGDQFGVHRAMNNNNWETVVSLEFPTITIQDFTVFKQNVYLVNERQLWKVNGVTDEQINFGNLITGVSHFKEKLVITGDFSDGENNPYGIAYSDDGLVFTPFGPTDGDFVTPGYFSFRGSNKIFLGSGDSYTYEYDGAELRKIEFRQVFFAVDSKDNFYTMDRFPDGMQQIIKWTNGITVKIGGPFSKENIINTIFLKDDNIIAIGDNSASGISVSYFLNKNDWIPIPTTNKFFGTFEHNDKILGYTGDGIIAELVYD